MAWKEITITDEGEKMLSGMVNGSKLIITKAVVGGITVPTEELSTQTGITEPLTTVPALLAGQEPTEDGKGIIIKIQVRNDNVTETTRMRQVGIYAKTEHDEEVLFVILQDETGEEIPAYDEFPQFKLEQWVTLSLSRTNNITVIVSPLVYVSYEEYQKLLEYANALEIKIKEIEKYSSQMMRIDITIPHENWNVEEQDSTLYIDIALDNVTEEMIPIISIFHADMDIATECGMSTSCYSYNGGIRLYAEKAPTAEIHASLILLYAYSGVIGDGVTAGNYELPIATATRLGGIKIGDGINVKPDGTASVDVPTIKIATLDKTKQVINEVFRSKTDT